MERINIVFLYSSKGFAGIPRNLSLILGRINPQHFACSIILLGAEGDEEADFRDRCDSGDAIRNFYRINSGQKLSFTSIRKIAEILTTEKADILSCHGYKADFYGFCLKYLFFVPVKLLTIAHGWVSSGPKFRFYHALDRVLMTFFDKVVLVEESQRTLVSWIPDSKLEVVNNGVDFEAFSAKSRCEPIFKEVGLDDRRFLVAFCGRLSPEKDVATAIRAIAELAESHEDIDLALVGEGPDQLALESLASELGVADRVHFLGYRKKMRALYSIFDAYISCSQAEGLPNSVMEAMAAGKPCVLSDIPGHSALVENQKNGFLVKLGDYKAFAARLAELSDSRELRLQIKDEARKTVRKKFSLTKRIEKLEKIYTSLME